MPAWPISDGQARRAQVVGEVAVHAAAQPGEAQHRAVAGHHARPRSGSAALSFENAGPEPQRELHRLGAGDPVAARTRSTPSWSSSARRAAARKIVRSASAEHRRPRRRSARARPSPAPARPARAPAAPTARGRARRRATVRRVPPSERQRARSTGSLVVPGRRKWRKPADRRPVAPGQRAAAAAEPEPLEQHAPQDRLLERDRCSHHVPIWSSRPEPGREAAEEHPHADVERDLDRVHGVDRRSACRSPAAPTPRTPCGPLGERARRPTPADRTAAASVRTGPSS